MKTPALALIVIVSACGGAQQAQQPTAEQAAASQATDKKSRQLFDEGKAAFNRGDYDAAIRAWEEGYAAKPAPEFQFNLGEAELKAGRPAKAAEHLRQYLKDAPAKAPNREQVEATLKQLDSAASQDEAQRLFSEGQAKYADGKYDEAIAAWEAGYAKAPSPTFTYNISQAYLAAGKKDDALKYLQRYLQEAPNGAMRSAVEKQIQQLQRRK